jgi:hypothetical protein
MYFSNEDKGIQKISLILKVTYLLRGMAGIQTQADWPMHLITRAYQHILSHNDELAINPENSINKLPQQSDGRMG